MKRSVLTFVISITVIAMFLSILLSIKSVEAQPDYSIERVNHTVKALYNGYVLINDTIEISGTLSEPFLLGFPHKYGPHIVQVIAHSCNDISNTFPVRLNAPLSDRVGFYGVEVDFSTGAPQAFSVEFVLSNNLLAPTPQNTSLYKLDFPTFPSLTMEAGVCNGSIVLPESAEYAEGTVDAFMYSRQNLTAFTSSESYVIFSLINDKIQLLDIKRFKREVKVDEFGEMGISDFYYLTNSGLRPISSIEVFLLPNASSPQVRDQFNRHMSTPAFVDANTSHYRITFTHPVEGGKSAGFTVDYVLPKKAYIEPAGQPDSLALNIVMFKNINYYIDRVSVVFVLPEGGSFRSISGSLMDGSYVWERNVFQETMTINRLGVTFLESLVIGIVYEHNPLWLAFRPTSWVFVLTIIGSMMVFLWKRPKTTSKISLPSPSLGFRPEYIKSFVDLYEEKMKIVLDIDSLEGKVRRRKIPRRRYKVRKKTFETRLNALSSRLTELKYKMRSAGGHYSNMMRQLEVAETVIEEAEANVRSIESRHDRGELSLEAYRKLVGDYQRRKSKAELEINGILLRLREEIR
jgi:hypothetical protein